MNAVCLLPSLNRPELLKNFFKFYVEQESEIPVWVLVDKEDPQKEHYLQMDLPKGSRVVLTNRRTMGEKFEEVFDLVKDFDFITIANDDHEPRTKHWDQKIAQVINGTNVVATNDGETPDKPWNAPRRICGAISISGPIIKALGYILPPGLKHLYSDDVWGVLFSKAGNCQFLMDVCFFHNHAYFDPKKRDATYLAVNGEADFQSPEPKGGMWDEDRETFKKWLEKDAESDAQKVLDLQPKTGVMIATPTQDGQVAMGYALGLADVSNFCMSNNIYFEFARVQGSSLLPHARNTLCDMFLKSRCQKLLFIDADQSFNRNTFFHLLNSNRRIIAGVTPHKRYPLNMNFEPLPQDHHFFKSLNNKGPEEFFQFVKAKADQKGEVEVNRAGTGILMIDRSVLELMKPHVEKYLAFDDRLDAEHYEFFKMGALRLEEGEHGYVEEKKNARFRGEDWYFEVLAKKLNIPIYINANALAQHQGMHNFTIDEGLRA